MALLFPLLTDTREFWREKKALVNGIMELPSTVKVTWDGCPGRQLFVWPLWIENVFIIIIIITFYFLLSVTFSSCSTSEGITAVVRLSDWPRPFALNVKKKKKRKKNLTAPGVTLDSLCAGTIGFVECSRAERLLLSTDWSIDVGGTLNRPGRVSQTKPPAEHGGG